MINNVVLLGRITKDLELRKTQNGKDVLSFSVAVDRTPVNGQKQTDFINCQAWGNTATNITRFFHKGSLIGLEGSIRTGSYNNKQGQKVYTTDVLVNKFSFCEKSEQGNQQGYGNQQSHQQGYGNVYPNQMNTDSGFDEFGFTDEDLPF